MQQSFSRARFTSIIRSTAVAASLTLLFVAASTASASSYTVAGDAFENYNFGSGTSMRYLNNGYGTTSNAPFEASGSSDYDVHAADLTSSTRVFSSSDAEGGSAHLDSTVSDMRDYKDGPAGTFEQYDSDATATLTIDDVVITGTGTTVSTKLNLHIAGSLQAGSDQGINNGIGANASVNLLTYFNNTVVGTGNYQVRSTDGSSQTGGGGDMLANFTGNNIVSTNSFNAPVNTPFTVKIMIGIGTTAAISGDNEGLAEAVADFGDTLSFATSGQVFTLPAGYTASSASAGIIANTYVETPEPCTLGLIAGVGMLTFSRSRRRATSLK